MMIQNVQNSQMNKESKEKLIDTLETHANPVRRSITSSHHRIPIGAQSFAL
jgi:hypothetical protein